MTWKIIANSDSRELGPNSLMAIYIARNKDDSFEMEIYDPIKTSDKDRSEKNKIDISLALNKIIEKMILRDPGQWIWTHNRWK